jgi:hypothetical protein
VPSRLASSLYFGTAFSVGIVLAVITCSTPPIVPGVGTGASGSLCSYPRGCYLVQKDGSFPGQCSDCSGGPSRCRLYFVPTPNSPNPNDLGGVFVPAGSDLGGTGLSLPVGDGPSIADQPALCSMYAQVASLPDDLEAACAIPEALCVARGPLCSTTGFCVRLGQSCEAGVPYAPQHRPGAGGPDTYCPYTDDVCCPGASSSDAGNGDMGSVDAAPVDARPVDATIG